MTWRQRSKFAPWSGLFAGALGWVLDHQIGAHGLEWNCQTNGPAPNLMLGAACSALVALGMWVAWASRSDSDLAAGRPEVRRLGVPISLAAGAIFLLAIAFQTVAGLIIPACQR
ncbi:MAG: hypothetical protein JWM33_362 [Caulobacteraceae bacterium]|nr:hypothetical protein [Caulobacteraceae bacterium]